jgi:hypothetical protein
LIECVTERLVSLGEAIEFNRGAATVVVGLRVVWVVAASTVEGLQRLGG